MILNYEDFLNEAKKSKKKKKKKKKKSSSTGTTKRPANQIFANTNPYLYNPFGYIRPYGYQNSPDVIVNNNINTSGSGNVTDNDTSASSGGDASGGGDAGGGE